jgi:hypothetical protein
LPVLTGLQLNRKAGCNLQFRKGVFMATEWEVDEKLPRFNDIADFDVQIYGQNRRARLAGNRSMFFSPGTWHFIDCTHPAQNAIFSRDDVTAWRFA